MKSYGWYEDSSSIFISMEYCRHGDLHQYLSANDKLPVEEAQQVTWQILEGLHEMHTNDFAHRDLKPGVSGFPLSVATRFVLTNMAMGRMF